MFPVKNGKIAAALLLSFILCSNMAVPARAEESGIKESELYARSAVLMDAASGRILYEKNGEERLPMASTTKVMTLLVTLENANLDDMAEVSDYAASMPDVQLNIRPGERYRLRDLVYSLMLESHNDSAVAIAEHVGGSVEKFADMMNQKARDIGCYDTYFITPNGLDKTVDGKEHSTTAADLARILSYAVTNSPEKEEFLKITRTADYSFTDESGNRSFSCHNHNAFLEMMDGALTGKTGFTGNAGYCYTGALRRDDRTFVVALLACGWPNNRSYKWSDTKKLMNYGLENYTYHRFDEVPVEQARLTDVVVEDGQTEEIGGICRIPVRVIAEEDGQVQGALLREGESIRTEYQIAKHLDAPVEKGKKVGNVTYYIGNEVFKVLPVVTAQRAERITYQWCFERTVEKAFGFAAILNFFENFIK